MNAVLRLARALERFNATVGRATAWLALAMVLIGAFNALARYSGKLLGAHLSSNAYIELQWYLFSALFLLGAAETLRADAHVRVDVLYGRLSPRARAAIDVVGTLVFLLPFCVFVFWVSLPAVANSWHVMEQSPDPGGLPRYPIKTLIPVALALVFLQGLALLFRRLSVLLGHEDADRDAAETEVPGDV